MGPALACPDRTPLEMGLMTERTLMELTAAEQDPTTQDPADQDLAEQDPAEEAVRLRLEVAQLRYALTHRPPTEHVVGMIMLAASCDAATAWAVLAKISQDTNRKASDLAVLISAHVAAGQGLPADLTSAIADADRPAAADQQRARAAQQRALIRRVHSAPH